MTFQPPGLNKNDAWTKNSDEDQVLAQELEN